MSIVRRTGLKLDPLRTHYRVSFSAKISVCASQRRGSVSITRKQSVNLLKPTGYVMHQQFNIQQLYILLTLYLCVLYLSENKQRLVPLTA